MMKDFAAWAKRGLDGWTVLHDEDCIKLKHNATGRVFTVRKVDDRYWDLYASSLKIDGPRATGTLVARLDGLRSALVAIGFIKQLR